MPARDCEARRYQQSFFPWLHASMVDTNPSVSEEIRQAVLDAAADERCVLYSGPSVCSEDGGEPSLPKGWSSNLGETIDLTVSDAGAATGNAAPPAAPTVADNAGHGAGSAARKERFQTRGRRHGGCRSPSAGRTNPGRISLQELTTHMRTFLKMHSEDGFALPSAEACNLSVVLIERTGATALFFGSTASPKEGAVM